LDYCVWKSKIVSLGCLWLYTQIHFVNILTFSTHSLDKALFAVHHWRRTSCSGAIEITLTLPISVLSTCHYFWKKSSSTNFLWKINQVFQWTDHVVWGASVLNCHNFVTPFRDFSVLCCFSLRCFDFANGPKRVAQYAEHTRISTGTTPPPHPIPQSNLLLHIYYFVTSLCISIVKV